MSVPQIPVGRVVFLSFLECEIRGKWSQELYKGGYEWIHYIAKDDTAELWLVRPDSLKRAFSFREGSKIQIGMMTVSFNNQDTVNEIAVDENAKAGKPPVTKLEIGS
jgi:hypothetical protein